MPNVDPFEKDREQVKEIEAKMEAQEERRKARKEYKDTHGGQTYSLSKEYHQNYYKTVEKNKKRNDIFCDVCQRNVTYSSFNSHCKTQKHKANEMSLALDKARVKANEANVEQN